MNLMRSQTGFTLVEMIVVIVITGIIAAVVAVFLQAPIQQYMDVARRAEMTDIADTALRRISRDLRTALPNSVTVTGGCTGSDSCTLEFIPTAGGGRYRVGSGDELDFTQADTSFDVVGPMPPVDTTNHIVVYNLGIPDADAYDGNTASTHVRRGVAATGSGNITITSTNPLPFESPGQRFHVVTTPVRYVCAPNAATPGLGTLTRISDYGWNRPPAGGTGRLLAQQVGRCRFEYSQNVVSQRTGLVTLHLSLAQGGETVSLYQAVHVNNQP